MRSPALAVTFAGGQALEDVLAVMAAADIGVAGYPVFECLPPGESHSQRRRTQ